MEKQLKDYLFLHIGCKVQYTGTGKPIKSLGRVCVLTHDNFELIAFSNNRKPILRPVSDMTEEEFKEIVYLQFGLNRDIIEDKIHTIKRTKEIKQATKYGTAIPYSAFDKEGNHYMTATLSFNSLNPHQFLFALSIQLDIFDLIEAGLAIDKTLQTANKED